MVAGEGSGRFEHHVEQNPNGIDLAPHVETDAIEEFWRHGRQRAGPHALGREGSALLGCLCNAEI